MLYEGNKEKFCEIMKFNVCVLRITMIDEPGLELCGDHNNRFLQKGSRFRPRRACAGRHGDSKLLVSPQSLHCLGVDVSRPQPTGKVHQ